MTQISQMSTIEKDIWSELDVQKRRQLFMIPVNDEYVETQSQFEQYRYLYCDEDKERNYYQQMEQYHEST